MNRRLYLVAAAAIAVIAGVSVYIASTVSPNDIAASKNLDVLESSVPSIAAAKGWMNSPPLGPSDLEGKVVLYDFWTYSCINCQRTFPHLKALYDRYKSDGLVIIGVHSPEFDFEKNHDDVARAVGKYGVTWPVALDDDMAIWNAFDNRYWPAEYLTDRQGQLRQVRFGEGDYDDKENDVRTLLGVAADSPRAAAAGADQVVTAAITPELHFGLGFDGASNNSSPQRQAAGVQTYTAPDPVKQDTFALQGQWNVSDQDVESVDAQSVFELRYRASEVNLVAGASSPTPVVIELDGQPFTTITVMDHDLYNIVTNGPSGAHTLTFRPSGAGVQAYAFTFGAGTK